MNDTLNEKKVMSHQDLAIVYNIAHNGVKKALAEIESMRNILSRVSNDLKKSITADILQKKMYFEHDFKEKKNVIDMNLKVFSEQEQNIFFENGFLKDNFEIYILNKKDAWLFLGYQTTETATYLQKFVGKEKFDAFFSSDNYIALVQRDIYAKTGVGIAPYPEDRISMFSFADEECYLNDGNFLF